MKYLTGSDLAAIQVRSGDIVLRCLICEETLGEVVLLNDAERLWQQHKIEYANRLAEEAVSGNLPSQGT